MIKARECAQQFSELMQPTDGADVLPVYLYHYCDKGLKDFNFNYSCDPYNRVGLNVLPGANTSRYKSPTTNNLSEYWKAKGYC